MTARRPSLLPLLAAACWCLLAPAAAAPRMAGVLAGGFRIRGGFSCLGRPYGFYADPLNDCRAYHVCEPPQDPTPEDPHAVWKRCIDYQWIITRWRIEVFSINNEILYIFSQFHTAYLA